jgi:hypothetical protein
MRAMGPIAERADDMEERGSEGARMGLQRAK